jgi:thiamine phosphate synthase YjbQ (UPF0047 family)
VTSVEIPFSIAAALPSLAVVDVTNDVARAVSRSPYGDGIAYLSSGETSLVRIAERESGLFEDLECFLERLVPKESNGRERMLAFLLGPRTEQIPFSDGGLCLGRYQRILVFSFDESCRSDWTLTLLG